MRGSQLMERYMAAVRADVRLKGKPNARRQHLSRLTAMRDRLVAGQSAGHDTTDAALRELVSFVLQPRTSPGRTGARLGVNQPQRQSQTEQQQRPRGDVSLYLVNGNRRRAEPSGK